MLAWVVPFATRHVAGHHRAAAAAGFSDVALPTRNANTLMPLQTCQHVRRARRRRTVTSFPRHHSRRRRRVTPAVASGCVHADCRPSDVCRASRSAPPQRQPVRRCVAKTRSVHAVSNTEIAFAGAGAAGRPALPAGCDASPAAHVVTVQRCRHPRSTGVTALVDQHVMRRPSRSEGSDCPARRSPRRSSRRHERDEQTGCWRCERPRRGCSC